MEIYKMNWWIVFQISSSLEPQIAKKQLAAEGEFQAD